MHFRKTKILTAFLFLLIGHTSVSLAKTVTLTWDPSPDAATPGKIAGYKLYVSMDVLTNVPPVDSTNAVSVSLGLQTSAVVSNLLSGVTYYFAVTSLDSLGLESDLSNIASYTVPSNQADVPPEIQLGPNGPTNSVPATNVVDTGSNTNGANSGNSDAPRQASMIGLLPKLSVYQTNGQSLIAISGAVGASLTLQRSTDIANPVSWTTVATVKLSEPASNANHSPSSVLEKAFVPSIQSWVDSESPTSDPRFYRILMPLGYPILADEVLKQKGFSTRLVAIRLPGLDAYIVCYVTEEGAYLDYNGGTFFVRLEPSGPTIREIATKVSSTLAQNWTSASEFFVSDGLKTITATVVQTDPPAMDPPIGTVQNLAINIDF